MSEQLDLDPDEEEERAPHFGRRASDRRGTLERHAQTVLVAIVVCLIGWVGLSITGLRETTQSLRGDIGLVNERVASLQKQWDVASPSQYTASQAVSDLRLRDQRIDENARRISELERAVTAGARK